MVKDILKISIFCIVIFFGSIYFMSLFIECECEKLPQPTKEKSSDIGEKVSNDYIQ